MNDDWTQDTTDVLHCSMPPQVRAHIEQLRDEVGRLRAAEVPLSANVGFAYTSEGYLFGEDGATEKPWPTANEARIASLPAGASTVVALIPVTAWDRT